MVIGTDTRTGEPVVVPWERRTSHILAVGATGAGKSVLLERLIRQDLLDGTTCIVFDVHGELIGSLLEFASTLPQERADRILVIEPQPRRSDGQRDPAFGCNLYQIPEQGQKEQTLAGVKGFVERFWGNAADGPVITRGIENTAQTIMANPGYTMAEVPLMYEDKALRAHLLGNIPRTGPRRLVHGYWREYDHHRSQDQDIWSSSVINKLTGCLTDENVYPVVAQGKSTIPWDGILAGRRSLFVRIPESWGTTCNYLNGLVLNEMTRYMQARFDLDEQTDHPRVHVYLDEYGRYASLGTTTLIATVRKANVGLTLAVQELTDFEVGVPPGSKAAHDAREKALQAKSRIIFHSSRDVAAEVASGFAKAPQPEVVKKGIAQNPFDYLVGHTHSDDEVRAITQATLTPISDALGIKRYDRDLDVQEESEESARAGVWTRPSWDMGSSPYNRYQDQRTRRQQQTRSTDKDAVKLAEARQQINRLLVDVMERRDGRPPASFRFPADMFSQVGDRSVRLWAIITIFHTRFASIPGKLRAYVAVAAVADLLPADSPVRERLGSCAFTIGHLEMGTNDLTVPEVPSHHMNELYSFFINEVPRSYSLQDKEYGLRLSLETCTAIGIASDVVQRGSSASTGEGIFVGRLPEEERKRLHAYFRRTWTGCESGRFASWSNGSSPGWRISSCSMPLILSRPRR